MISSLLVSHGKFLLDYIVGKVFELDIELKQTFLFLPAETLKFGFTAHIQGASETHNQIQVIDTTEFQ